MVSETERKRLSELYKYLESCFTVLLQRVNVPSEVRECVEEYVYYGEYGVAFECFVAMCVKGGVVLSDDLTEIVEQMANRMGYDLEQLRKKFS
jgi:hypothetical protein